MFRSVKRSANGAPQTKTQSIKLAPNSKIIDKPMDLKNCLVNSDLESEGNSSILNNNIFPNIIGNPYIEKMEATTFIETPLIAPNIANTK